MQQEINQMTISLCSLNGIICMLSLKERDNAEAKQRELQRELDNLNERMEASQRAWTATKRELAQYEGRYTHLDREVHNKSIVAQNAESQYRNFKELLARMLCDGACVVEPYEEQIREQVQRLLTAVHDRSSVGVIQITTNQSPSLITNTLETVDGAYKTTVRKSKAIVQTVNQPKCPISV